jgi:cellobiose-specific phosphotransferase system component IIC
MDSEVSTHTHSWQRLLRNLSVSCRVNQFFFAIILMWYTRNIFVYIFFINWTLRMSDNLPERVQILCHVHINICITVLEKRIICCQIFCDLLLKSTFEWIFNVMQLILVKIKWHIKWKYLIQKFHDICLLYYFYNFNQTNLN